MQTAYYTLNTPLEQCVLLVSLKLSPREFLSAISVKELLNQICNISWFVKNITWSISWIRKIKRLVYKANYAKCLNRVRRIWPFPWKITLRGYCIKAGSAIYCQRDFQVIPSIHCTSIRVIQRGQIRKNISQENIYLVVKTQLCFFFFSLF